MQYQVHVKTEAGRDDAVTVDAGSAREAESRAWEQSDTIAAVVGAYAVDDALAGGEHHAARAGDLLGDAQVTSPLELQLADVRANPTAGGLAVARLMLDQEKHDAAAEGAGGLVDDDLAALDAELDRVEAGLDPGGAGEVGEVGEVGDDAHGLLEDLPGETPEPPNDWYEGYREGVDVDAAVACAAAAAAAAETEAETAGAVGDTAGEAGAGSGDAAGDVGADVDTDGGA